MRKSTGVILFFLCIALIFAAGCTSPDSSGKSPVETPTPQIVYVTVLVTPTPEVVPETAAPVKNPDTESDEEFIEYVNTNQVIDGMTALTTVNAGSYSATTGYNAAAKNEAFRLTELLLKAPLPGSDRVKMLRSAMMNALAMMDGSTAGFTRYKDAMQAVIKENNAVQSELHSLGLSSIDAKYLSGRGSDVRTFNVTEPGQKTFTMHHNGDRNFAVILKDENKNYISLLANEIGEYSGKKSERLAVGQYYLEITADGEWTIGIESV